MIYEERLYQIEAEDALMRDIDKGNPVIAVPTGAGKTKIMGGFIYKYLVKNPLHNILILANSEEILKQNHEAICRFFPGIIIGLYSSGLGSRTIEKITVAGIQSVHKKPDIFDHFNVVLIDEAHCVPSKGKGMYRRFLKDIPATRVGLSATIYRKGTGLIYEGEGAPFDILSYDLCTLDKFNELVDNGYLSKLFSKPTKLKMDTKQVKVSAGDYNQKALSEKFDREAITNAAVKETIKFGHNYESWLVFAIDIKHANHIHEKLLAAGIASSVLHSDTSHMRTEIIDDFKNKITRCVVSVGMVTTGFDAPNIDLIILLRPTKSPVLHVQMVGRGLRTNPGKDHCLVLDFAGNTARLGPINDVTVPGSRKKGKGGGEPIIKTCPECGCMHHPTVRICNVCNHVFEFKQKIKTVAEDVDVVRKSKEHIPPEWIRVTRVQYYVHSKIGKPDSLKVVYTCGLYTITDYVCLEHSGYAREKAINWLNFRWNGPLNEYPTTVEQAFNKRSHITIPKELLVLSERRYPEIIDYKL